MPRKFPLVSRKRFEELRQRYGFLSQESEKIAAQRDSLARDRDSLAQTLNELAKVFSVSWLIPVATCRTQAEWNQFCASPAFEQLQREDGSILAQHQLEEEWQFHGYSSPAQRFVGFKVDNLAGGGREGNRFIPNIRERLVCPVTGLNNRQRLMALLISTELLEGDAGSDVYLMEQVTSLYRWMSDRFVGHRVVGSEYLGDVEPGQVVEGIRHENIHKLSFDSSSIDLILSADVMEHVPCPQRAFGEIARVLRPGGQALMTFPFDVDQSESVVRAEVVNSAVVHRHEPVYHGNPVSEDGSLVFTDFGWDLMEAVRARGFRDAALEIYHSAPLGHLGLGLIFRFLR